MNIHTRLETGNPVTNFMIPRIGSNCSSNDWIEKRPSSRCWRESRYKSVSIFKSRSGIDSKNFILRYSQNWTFRRFKSSGLCWRRDYYHKVKNNPSLKGKL